MSGDNSIDISKLNIDPFTDDSNLIKNRETNEVSVCIPVSVLTYYKDQLFKIINPQVSFDEDHLKMAKSVIEKNSDNAESIYENIQGLIDWENYEES